MNSTLDIFGACPNCGSEWGYLAPVWPDDAWRPFSRLIGVVDRDEDRVACWRCPDCKTELPR
jgi:predicted Zn-ribbon and HTH transcriptional regulator